MKTLLLTASIVLLCLSNNAFAAEKTTKWCSFGQEGPFGTFGFTTCDATFRDCVCSQNLASSGTFVNDHRNWRSMRAVGRCFKPLGQFTYNLRSDGALLAMAILLNLRKDCVINKIYYTNN